MKKITTVNRFFDFYSIIELYLRTGGFRDIGYPGYSVFVTQRAEDKIRQAYERIVDSFYARIYTALVESVRSELHHYPGSTLDSKEKQIKEMGINVSQAKKRPGMYPENAHILFTLPRWVSGYGGKKWAGGTALLIEAKKVKTHAEKVYWVDRVLDLYHNCGHMINKTEYRTLSSLSILWKSKTANRTFYSTPLDFRAKAKSIMEYIPHNSIAVKRLVIPQKKLLTFA